MVFALFLALYVVSSSLVLLDDYPCRQHTLDGNGCLTNWNRDMKWKSFINIYHPYPECSVLSIFDISVFFCCYFPFVDVMFGGAAVFVSNTIQKGQQLPPRAYLLLIFFIAIELERLDFWCVFAWFCHGHWLAIQFSGHQELGQQMFWVIMRFASILCETMASRIACARALASPT